MLKIGDRLPEFTLNDQDDSPFNIKSVIGKPLVLFFYPKDHSPGCTAEVCSFRDQHEVFQEYGATVIGVSFDSVESHKKFSKRHRLPFTLLSDPKRKVQKLFGITKSTFGVSYSRVTFVVDREGIIVKILENALMATSHIRLSLKALKLL
mgnify:CR=1 FL=1